jgi:hypothetical protein
MTTAILITHFVFGGLFYFIITNLHIAISEYYDTKNWLNQGRINSLDYQFALRKLFSWSCVLLAYIVAYATIIYLSIIQLANS